MSEQEQTRGNTVMNAEIITTASTRESTKPQSDRCGSQVVPIDGYMKVDSVTAEYWLANFNYCHQRSIRTYHVQNLADEIKHGRFREKTQINFCRLNDRFFLTNGQHTLSAIVRSGLPCLLHVVVLEVSNMDEVADDFSRHDTHLTRQLSTAMVAHEIHEEFCVTKTELNWISAAAFLYEYMIGKTAMKSSTQMTNDAKISIVRKHGALGSSALRTMVHVNADRRRHLVRKTTLACAMIVYNSSPDLCREFFGVISEDDGLRVGDPRKTLLEYLRETNTGATGIRESRKVEASHRMIKTIASANNAFVSRKYLRFIRINHDAKTVTFSGIGEFRCLTPYEE